MPNPKMRRPNPHHRSSAHIENKQRQFTQIAANALSGAVFGLLLALLAVQWIDDSLGVEPGHVAEVAEVAEVAR